MATTWESKRVWRGRSGRKYQDRLTRLFYEKLERLPLEELLFLRDQLEKLRVQGRRSKFKLIKGRVRAASAFLPTGPS